MLDQQTLPSRDEYPSTGPSKLAQATSSLLVNSNKSVGTLSQKSKVLEPYLSRLNYEMDRNMN